MKMDIFTLTLIYRLFCVIIIIAHANRFFTEKADRQL